MRARAWGITNHFASSTRPCIAGRHVCCGYIRPSFRVYNSVAAAATTVAAIAAVAAKSSEKMMNDEDATLQFDRCRPARCDERNERENTISRLY